MKFSRYIGDMSIDLEGEPEEIIQVLEYLDGRNYEDREVVLCIMVSPNITPNIPNIDGEAINKALARQVSKALKVMKQSL